LRRHAQISPERFLGSTDVARLSEHQKLKDE